MRWGVRGGLVGAALLAAFVPMSPTAVERWYSAGIYPRVQAALTPVSNLVPFAWLDVLSLAAAIVVVAAVTRGARRARRARRWAPVLSTVAGLATAAAAVYLGFLLLWGLNYRRVPMLDRLVLEEASVDDNDVLTLGRRTVDALNALHHPAHKDGWSSPPWDDARFLARFADVQRLLSGAPPAVPGRLKGSLYGHYFRWTNVDGMVNPFGLEVIGNPDLLPFERPFVAAHEWAHLAGYADEAEASFVGWLTCVRGEPANAYSGWLFLYWQLRANLGRDERETLAAALEPGPAGDLEAIASRLRRGQVPRLRDASWRVYDGYLKANRVEEGVASYSEVVTLVLRARFEDNWTPVRR